MADGVELLNRADVAHGAPQVSQTPRAPACPNPFTTFLSEPGKPSRIHEYCVEPERQGKTCIWLCRRQGRRAVAWDRPDKDPDPEHGAGAFRLLGKNPWWSRFAFYNCVGVRHVQVRPEVE